MCGRSRAASLLELIKKGSARESVKSPRFYRFGCFGLYRTRRRRCWGNVGTRVFCGVPSVVGIVGKSDFWLFHDFHGAPGKPAKSAPPRLQAGGRYVSGLIRHLSESRDYAATARRPWPPPRRPRRARKGTRDREPTEGRCRGGLVDAPTANRYAGF